MGRMGAGLGACLAIAAIALSGARCGTGNSGTDAGTQARIGPSGGALEVTDPASPLRGLRVEIPAGALGRMATVHIAQEPVAPIAGLPVGFAAFEPAVRIEADGALAANVRVFFPLAAIPADQGSVPTAAYYDAVAGAWRAVLPRSLADGAFVVETTQWGRWRWGITRLREANRATLEPMMVQLHGEEGWNVIKDELETVFHSTIFPKLSEPENWDNCDALRATGEFFVALAQDAAHDLQTALATRCGGCDVTPDVFLDDLASYLRAKVRHFIVDLMLEACDLNFLLELYIKLEVAIYFDDVVRSLSCDYECLFESPPPGMWGSIATYYIASIGVLFVELGARYDDCI